MEREPDSLKQLALEVLGLTVAMGVLIVIAAFHVFGGFSSEGMAALVFTVTALGVTALPIQAYVLFRMASLSRENKKLFSRATTDGLTQVLNKTTFRTNVEATVSRNLRRSSDLRPHTLLIIDADHFKRINDRLGHATGDQALIAISTFLRRSVRQDDLVGRIGGEEFAVLLKGAGPDEAKIVAERLRTGIEKLVVGRRGQTARLSVSIGGLSFTSSLPYDVIYRAADANLYRAKRTGRNRVDLTSVVQSLRSPGGNAGATAALTRRVG